MWLKSEDEREFYKQKGSKGKKVAKAKRQHSNVNAFTCQSLTLFFVCADISWAPHLMHVMFGAIKQSLSLPPSFCRKSWFTFLFRSGSRKKKPGRELCKCLWRINVFALDLQHVF